MRIAQVAPLYESVPPRLYGGTERIVSYLTEELVYQGHDVTLFASGDSITQATLVSICPEALRLNKVTQDPLAYHFLMMQKVFDMRDSFDIVHFHIDYMHFLMSRMAGLPHVTTLHGRLDLPELKPLYEEFNDMPVISISDAQRAPLPYANWGSTVYHGLPEDLYTFNPQPKDYLVFIGRISPEKRVDRAIAIASRAGMQLKIAAKIDEADKKYYKREIESLMSESHVEFLGEVDEREKDELLGNAAAMLFPIDWPEPFGMVMIEAMACGTPVIAFPGGSVSEVLQHGKTGFIVENVEEAVAAVTKVKTIDRAQCRKVFEERFSASRMMEDYLSAYQKVLDSTSNQRISHAIRSDHARNYSS